MLTNTACFVHTGTLCVITWVCACAQLYVCSWAYVNVHEGERFPNMSLECLLYPIQYLFLAPHISVPIDSSDSRQDNNRTALPLSLSPPLLLPSPRSTTQGWRDGNREIKGGRTRGRRKRPLCATSFSRITVLGCKDGGRKREDEGGRGVEDAGRWREDRRRQLADAENLGNFGDNGGSCETGQRWFEREKTRGVNRQKNGTGSDGENGGRTVMGQEDTWD